MRKAWKKLIAYGAAAALTVTSLSVGGLADPTKTADAAAGGTGANRETTGSAISGSSTAYVEVPDNPAPYHDLTADELIEEMGTGWNLGNTMDAWNGNYIPGETKWQSVKTTKSLIKKVHDLGFNNIRIPVTWGNMINDEEDYSVDEIWMSRVQDIVDYAISENMYVTINIHHDGAYNGEDSEHGWLCLDGNEDDFAKVKARFEGVWKTIADRFKNYDEHLIFESMNEVFESDYGWSDDENEVNRGLRKINELNQIFVNAVRATGSNNEKRWLSVPTVNTQIKTMIQDRFDFQLPTDTVDGRLIVAAHDYDPWNVVTSPKETREDSYAQQFKALKEKYVDNGIPVVIGEYGFPSVNMLTVSYEGINVLFKKYKLIGMVWDNGYDDYKVIDRTQEETYKKNITDAIMRGYYVTQDAAGLEEEPAIVPITSFDISSSEVSLKAGESTVVNVSNLAPENSNDLVLWKSDNGEIASVSNGKIVARAIGTTKITAFSQSGSLEKEITVTVTPQTLTEASTGITTDYDAYELEKDGEAFINAKADTSDQSAYVTYQSSDDSVVSVSTMGKLVANGLGSAVVTVTTSDGYQKQIPVLVVEPAAPVDFKVRLAIHVQYNDNEKEYFGSEVGSDVITVDKDGTYTLKFDCATDLSDTAKEKNISTLNKLGSLYIKDYDVTTGEAKRSPNIAGKVRYNSIKVNGTELLDWETTNYDALKGMVFDTGNPLNAWDGSVVEDKITTDKENYNITFNDIAEPTQIEVTFTLSGFTGKVTQPDPKPTETAAAPPVTDQTAAPVTTATVSPSAVATTPAVENTPTVNTLAKGTTQTVSGVKYKVTNAKKKEVAYTSTKNKKVTKVTIKNTVKLTVNGKKVTYKVTTISKNAFKGCKKLKTVVIGKNIHTIKTGAFNGCSKVKKITVKSKVLKKVEKKALKGIHAKCKIKVPKKKLKSYKKLLKGKGQKKTVKITA